MIIYFYREKAYFVSHLGSLILTKNPDHEADYYGLCFDRYWWDMGVEERDTHYPGLEIDNDHFVAHQIQFETILDTHNLNTQNYCPAELGLAICYHLIKDLDFGYTTLTQAARDESCIASEIFFDEVFGMLAQNDLSFLNEIGFDLEPYKTGKAHFKHRANYHLDMTERLEGSSDFTRYAKTVLREGRRCFKTYAYLANKLIEQERAHTHLKLPQKALDFTCVKKSEVPGIWQVRKIKPHFAYWGDQVFIVCANEHNKGICFSLKPENFDEADIKLGDIVSIKARIAAKQEAKSPFLALNYVTVTKTKNEVTS